MLPTTSSVLLTCLLLVYTEGRELSISTKYKVSVGELVKISCPCSPESDCTESSYRYFNWSKSQVLSLENNFEPLYYLDRTFKLTVRNAKDGGFYRCFRSDQSDATWFVELRVLPQLELHPSTAETGVHTHETIRLCCVGSGFPRPELEWSPSEGFKQGRTYLDAYTVSTELVIENALPSMSGKYTCGARVFDGNCIRQDGECSFTDKRTTTLHTKLFIYAECKVQIISPHGLVCESSQSLSLECRVDCDDRLQYSVIWRHDREEIKQSHLGYSLMENPPLFLLSMAELNSSQAGIYGCEVVSQYSALEAVDRVNVQVIIKNNWIPDHTLRGIVACIAICTAAVCWWKRRRTNAIPHNFSQGRRSQVELISLRQFAEQHSMRYLTPSDNIRPQLL